MELVAAVLGLLCVILTVGMVMARQSVNRSNKIINQLRDANVLLSKRLQKAARTHTTVDMPQPHRDLSRWRLSEGLAATDENEL